MHISPVDLDVPFKGNRTYLRGADIFESLMRILHPHPPISLRFHKILDQPIELFAMAPTQRPNTVAAFFSFHDTDGRWNAAGIRPREGATVSRRERYDEDQVAALATVRGEFLEMPAHETFSFIDRVVAANKILVTRCVPAVEGRPPSPWLFTRLELSRIPGEPKAFSLRFVGSLSDRLTHSAIVVDGEEIGAIFYSRIPL